MASLKDLLRGKAAHVEASWAAPLFKSGLSPLIRSGEGAVLVWTVADRASTATITDQFKANAAEYHRRYAASDHFEALFRQALDATGLNVAERPLILDLGSGSGINSVVPCRRLFPGARIVATDLSGELLAMLAAYAIDHAAADEVVCVRMDAMSQKVTPGAFDLVTGASILHHLDSPSDALVAAGRALRPGGHAIFFEPFNGWAIVRLAFERILAEAALRGEPLEPPLDQALRQLIADVAERSPEIYSPALAAKDDKWLFSRSRIEISARDAGFDAVRFVPHNDHASLYRDVATTHVRLSVGHDRLRFPDWAAAILDSFDAALTLSAKRELMVEGSIVLSKGA
jgi:SAM-dependent methyltransferase